MKKFYIHTMGCKSNQFESDIIKENLIKNGLQEAENIETSDIFVLNSCTVTHKSDNEAFYLLRNAKHKNPDIINIYKTYLDYPNSPKAIKLIHTNFKDRSSILREKSL